MLNRLLGLIVAALSVLCWQGAAGAGSGRTRDGKTFIGAGAVSGDQVVVTTEQGKQAVPLSSLARASFKSPAAERPAAGHGLRGEYYAGRAFRTLLLTRDDSTIDFMWGDDAIPHPSLCPWGREFSIRWTGKLKANYSEKYTFTANTDDGVRVWVGGQLLI